MKDFAESLRKELQLPDDGELRDLTGEGHRYSTFMVGCSVYKLGCILCVNVSSKYAVFHSGSKYFHCTRSVTDFIVLYIELEMRKTYRNYIHKFVQTPRAPKTVRLKKQRPATFYQRNS